MTGATLYHHTDTARLPYILRSGCLKPGSNRIGGFPDPDFLWATTEPHGDRTASANIAEHYRAGKVLHVRFTFDADLFFPWREVRGRHPFWTSDQINRLESAARGKSDPSRWWCSAQSIPLSACTAIDIRSWSDNRWRPLDPETRAIETEAEGKKWLAVVIGTAVLLSRTVKGWNGAEGYEVVSGPLLGVS